MTCHVILGWPESDIRGVSCDPHTWPSWGYVWGDPIAPFWAVGIQQISLRLHRVTLAFKSSSGDRLHY